MDLDMIDRLVGEKVMGWHLVDIPPSPFAASFQNWCDEGERGIISASEWHPTRDPKHTLMVIQHFVARGITFRLHSDPGFNEANEHFHAWFSPVDLGPWPVWSRAADFGSAVSLAALRAYRVEVTA